MSYWDEKLDDNKLYARIWLLIAILLCCALFKGCDAYESDTRAVAARQEAERNAAAFALSECTSKSGTMYAGQCVICPRN